MSQELQNSGARENKMGIMPIDRLLWNMVLPMIIAMVVQALYNVVDSIYVSRISESAVTALSLAFPVQNMQIGFAVGVGVGVNAMLSKCLGEHNQQEANRTAGNGFFLVGIAGAAVATVIGQWIAAILAVIFNLKCNPDIQFGLQYLRPRKENMLPIPTVIMNGIGSVMNFGMNQILQGFRETATGVFGVYFKLHSFFLMPLFGINNATISIVAYNYGARKPKRITRVLKISCGVAFAIMVAGLAAFQLFPEVLLSMFNPTEDFMGIGCSALRIISSHFLLAAICVALSASFQALGNGIYSSITSLCRQLLVLLPAAYLLSLTGDVHNVWWSFPVAEVASFIVTMILFSRIYRKKIRPLFAE